MVNKRAAKSACENLNESDGKGEDMQKRGDLSIRGENDTLLLFIIITICYFFYTYFPKYFFIYPTLYRDHVTFLYSALFGHYSSTREDKLYYNLSFVTQRSYRRSRRPAWTYARVARRRSTPWRRSRQTTKFFTNNAFGVSSAIAF